MGQSAPTTDEQPGFIEHELQVVAAVREAATRGDDGAVDARLTAAPLTRRAVVSGALLARRAASACAWLRNDNEYRRARELAQRVVQTLARADDENDADRVERLYWEAWLHGEVLGQRKRAVELLQTAEKLAPNDVRISEDALRFARALAEFGE